MPKIDRKIFLAVLLCLHTACALPLAFYLNVWMDEASSLYTTRAGLVHAFQNVFADEKQAPLYFLILSVWRALDDSVFFARILSLVFSLSAIWYFSDAARRFAGERAGLYLTALFALHPYLFWASTEIRGYSLVILLSVLILKFFAEAYLDETERSRAKRNWFTALAAVALYANYYLGFLLVAGFAALLVLRRFRAARDYFLRMMLVGALFAPLLWIAARQFAVNTNGFTAEKTLAEGVSIVWEQLREFVFPMQLAPDAAPSPVSLARLWFLRLSAALLIFFLFKNKFRAFNERVAAAGVFPAIVVLFLLAAYFLLGTPYVAARHFALLLAPLVLFLGALAANAFPRRALIAFAVAFAVLFPFSKIYKQFPDYAKRGDWARVARFIEEREKPNQPIIVFKTYDALSLPVHYRGINRIVPDERFFEWPQEASLQSEDAFRRQIEFVVSEIPADAREIWLATEEVCQWETTLAACRPLENFIEANYTVVETKDFFQERVRLLRKK